MFAFLYICTVLVSLFQFYSNILSIRTTSQLVSDDVTDSYAQTVRTEVRRFINDIFDLESTENATLGKSNAALLLFNRSSIAQYGQKEIIIDSRGNYRKMAPRSSTANKFIISATNNESTRSTEDKDFIPVSIKTIGYRAVSASKLSSSTNSTNSDTYAPYLLPTVISANEVNISKLEMSRVMNIKSVCGVEGRKGRIVGGIEDSDRKWPWMVAIFLLTRRGTEYWCGGTLISDRYVLTAAHCLTHQNGNRYKTFRLRIRVGDHHLFRSDDGMNPMNFNVAETIIHPEFSYQEASNDVAIIKLQKAIELSSHVLPVCLPSEKLAKSDLAGYVGFVAGWGRTEYGGYNSGSLHYVSVPIWENEQCDTKYPQTIGPGFLCAGYKGGGKDACQGDSGSPLVVQDENNKWNVVGIVGFATKCALPGVPGVYARVSYYQKWITEKAV